jgi:hypothetical protein
MFKTIKLPTLDASLGQGPDDGQMQFLFITIELRIWWDEMDSDSSLPADFTAKDPRRYSLNPLSGFELCLLSLEYMAQKNCAWKKTFFSLAFGGTGNQATQLEHSWGGWTTGMFMSPASRTGAITRTALRTNVFTVEKDSSGLHDVSMDV